MIPLLVLVVGWDQLLHFCPTALEYSFLSEYPHLALCQTNTPRLHGLEIVIYSFAINSKYEQHVSSIYVMFCAIFIVPLYSQLLKNSRGLSKLHICGLCKKCSRLHQWEYLIRRILRNLQSQLVDLREPKTKKKKVKPLRQTAQCNSK